MLPLEVLVHLLGVGAFNAVQLAPLRLVNRAMCAAASDRSLYRDVTVDASTCVDTLPAFVRESVVFLTLDGDGSGANTGEWADLMPNMTSLSMERLSPNVAVTGLPSGLCELGLTAYRSDVLEAVGALTKLECLSLLHAAVAPPLALLSSLRRLTLRNFAGHAATLLTALAASPCAASLEALHLGFFFAPKAPPGTWTSLTGLSGLRELAVMAYRPLFPVPGAEEGFASVLPTLDSLDVLVILSQSDDLGALICRGLPGQLRTLYLAGRGVPTLFASLAPVLPPTLTALGVGDAVPLSGDDLATVMNTCPNLRGARWTLNQQGLDALATAA